MKLLTFGPLLHQIVCITFRALWAEERDLLPALKGKAVDPSREKGTQKRQFQFHVTPGA
jgi:hypothetical protein